MKTQIILLGASAAIACAQRIDFTVGPITARWPTVYQNFPRHFNTTTVKTTTTTTPKTMTTTSHISSSSPPPSSSSSSTTTTTSSLSIRPIPTPTTSDRSTLSTTSQTTSEISTTKYSNCLTDSTETYINSVYPTVYETVDETVHYTVTVSGSGYTARTLPTASVEIETPLEACSSTLITSDEPAMPPTTTTRAASTSMSVIPTATEGSSTLTSHINMITSTVLVTRKTSVPVVFRPGATGGPEGFDPTTMRQSSHVPADTTPPGHGMPTTRVGVPGDDNGGPRPDDGSGPKEPPAQGDEKATSSFRPAPLTTSINNVGITIQPTAVIIGGTTVILPSIGATSAPPTVVVNGETYTIKPSEIVAPHTTFTMPTAASTITQAVSTVTAASLTFTIGPSYAIIEGTTYRIGANVPPVTLTIGSETITLNSNGLILPSSTFVPPMTLAIPQPQPTLPIYKIVVVDGMTISIDASEAIISGTTFGIGKGFTDNAPVTRTVDGRTITVDDAGVIVGTQTITATSIRASETEIVSSVPKSEASPSLVVATETGKGDGDDGNTNAGSRSRESVSMLYSLLLGLWAVL